MAELLNLARMTTSTTGTGSTIALDAAVSGFLSFANAGAQNGVAYSYAIRDGDDSEVGTAVYSTTGPSLTSRTPTESTNGGSAIDLSGSAEVIITPRAEDILANASTSERGRVELATSAEYRNNTSDRALTTDQVWSAMAEVTLTDAANISWDMSAGFDFVVTLTANRILDNPTNAKVGQKGRLRIVHSGAARTLSYGTSYECAAGTAPTLATAANDEDVLYYDVISSTRILITKGAGDIS
jgi:hypothetical protein